MSDPRRVAVQALLRQEQDGFANLILDSVLSKADLDGRDRAFVSTVFYGTIERLKTLDFCVNRFSKKPIAKLDGPVRAILRSGLYQAKYMQVPPSAAVNEAVKLTRSMGKSSAAGMVNAVLRKAVAFVPEEASFSGSVQRLSVLYSVDESVVEALLREYPEQAEAILAAAFLKPKTTIRVNTLKTTEDKLLQQLADEGIKAAQTNIPNCLEVTFKGSPAATKAFKSGMFHVQGVPSQLAALAVSPQPGQKVLDLCAAPGGKSAVLAQCMENTGRLYSCDLAANRLSLIEKQFARLGITNGTVLQRDGARHDPALENADRILCDVPCSGLGIIAKKPDIRYKKVDDLRELEAIQRAILENAASYLKPGGRLVYSTCTILPGENQNIIRDFLVQHKDFKLAEGPMQANAIDTGYGSLFLPGTDSPDGFFAAVMERE